MTRSTLVLAASLALMVTFVPPTIAASPQTKCEITKLNAATKKVASKLKCYTNALKKSVHIDPTCLAKAEQQFADVFAKVEVKTKGGCPTTGEAPSVESQVDRLFTGLVADEPDFAVCLSNGLICGAGTPCCPGLTCQFNQLQGFLTCLP